MNPTAHQQFYVNESTKRSLAKSIVDNGPVSKVRHRYPGREQEYLLVLRSVESDGSVVHDGDVNELLRGSNHFQDSVDVIFASRREERWWSGLNTFTSHFQTNKSMCPFVQKTLTDKYTAVLSFPSDTCMGFSALNCVASSSGQLVGTSLFGSPISQ